MPITLVRGISGVPGPEVQLNGTRVVNGAGVLNFTGGVAVTGSGETATIDITGGGGGSITEIQGGTGIDITAGTGPIVTVALQDTAVAPGSYGDSSHVGAFDVDQQGRLTSASSVAISAAAIGAVPTSRTITANAPLSGGGDLSADRSISLDAAAPSVLLGRRSGSAGAYEALTPGASLSISGTTLSVADTAVTSGKYGDASNVAQVTVDQQGRVTLAANVPITAVAIGAAPSNAQYVVLATSTGLSDERVLTAGALIDLVDAGAGSTITVDVDLTELSINAGEGQTTDYLPIVTAAGGQVRTLISDVITNAGIVPTSRTLTVNAPLSGGGDLSANRSISLNASAASRLLGRGSASGAGAFEEITLGSNLSMIGTVLSATGGGSSINYGKVYATAHNALTM